MRAILKVAILVLVAASCSGSGGNRMNTEINRGPMPEGGQWAGIWFTNWGEMTVSIQGSSVVGEFCQEERNRFGRLEGTTQGNVMSFHWITTDVTMAGASRQTEGSSIVQFSFIAAGENQSMHMEGTWGYERSNADGGVLSGNRSPQRSQQFLRGEYSMSCALRESAEAPPPLSTDDVEDNPDDYGEPEEEGDGLEDEGDEEPIDDLPM